MKNIIDAIVTLVERNCFDLTDSTLRNNRANSRGDALETYVKNLFPDTFNCSETERLEKWARLDNQSELFELQKDYSALKIVEDKIKNPEILPNSELQNS